MALVVPNICRFSLVGFYIDRPWVNIIDMQLDTTGTIEDRDDFAYETAGAIIDAWVDNIATYVSESCVLNSVDWTDLNSADGSVGQRIVTSNNTLPEAGFVESPALTGNNAALVTKRTARSRGTRNGRLYHTGLAENQIIDNHLGPGTQVNLQGSYNGFLSDINDTGAIPVNLSRQMVVVHTTGPNPTTGTWSAVEELVVESRLATQRRRLRG